MKKLFLLILILGLALPAFGQLQVGDDVPNFTITACANDTGTIELYDFNGAVNGGDYHVIFIEMFTSW